MSKSLPQLLNNIIGQLEGIKKMHAEKQDCLKILTQIKASRSAFDSLTSKFLEESLTKECSMKVAPEDQARLQKLLKEVIKS